MDGIVLDHDVADVLETVGPLNDFGKEVPDADRGATLPPEPPGLGGTLCLGGIGRL